MIEVNGISKYYGSFPAVTELSFSIEKHGIYGFLGPNGAGKSTTMNIIAGCLSADSGTVRIDGYDSMDDSKKLRSRIGYLPETPPLYMEMTPREYLSFVAGAKGIASNAVRAQADRAIELTGLNDYSNKLIAHLSKGYKQRVGIAQALLGSPSLIILDEPTVGLDPKQISDIRNMIIELGKECIVLFSSHILSDVQAVSDHVIIIAGGRLVADSSIEEIEKMLKADAVLKLSFHGSRENADRVIAGLSDELKNISSEQLEGDIISCEAAVKDTENVCEKLFYAAAAEDIPIVEMHYVTPSLEEAFIELTRGYERHFDRK